MKIEIITRDGNKHILDKDSISNIGYIREHGKIKILITFELDDNIVKNIDKVIFY